MLRRVTILGSGTILADPNRFCAGYLVETDEGPMLLDCGPGALHRLAQLGMPVNEIGLILLTHFHLDHISDLGALFVSRWLATIRGGNRSMRIVGPRGTAALLDWVREQAPEAKELALYPVELDAGRSTLTVQPEGGSDGRFVRIDSAPTGHTANSICYRLSDERGRALFYSGDTDYNESIIPLARDANMAILECSTPDERKIPGHLTPRLAGRLAAAAGVRRLILTHLYPELLASGVDIEAAVRTEYPGPLELAEDLRRYEL